MSLHFVHFSASSFIITHFMGRVRASVRKGTGMRRRQTRIGEGVSVSSRIARVLRDSGPGGPRCSRLLWSANRSKVSTCNNLSHVRRSPQHRPPQPHHPFRRHALAHGAGAACPCQRGGHAGADRPWVAAILRKPIGRYLKRRKLPSLSKIRRKECL